MRGSDWLIIPSTCLSQEKDTCIRKLEEKFDKDLMKEYEKFHRKEKRGQTSEDLVQAKEKIWSFMAKIVASREVATQTISIVAKMTGHIQIQIIRITQQHNNMQNKNKWVINISRKPLTTDEERLLAHGPNYAIILKRSTHCTVCSSNRECMYPG